MLPTIALRVKAWMVTKTFKRALFTICAVKLLGRRLQSLRNRADLDRAVGVAHQVSHICSAERRARDNLERQRLAREQRYRQVQRAGGVMNVAAKGLLPKGRQARAAVLKQQAERHAREIEEQQRIQAELDRQRKEQLERESKIQREARQRNEEEQAARDQQAREEQAAREEAVAAQKGDLRASADWSSFI